MSSTWGSCDITWGFREVHNKGNNIAYLDGHVAWSLVQQITNGMFMLAPDDRSSDYNHTLKLK